MYDLIIIDDEKAIRKGFEDIFDWGELGFRISSTFEDGKEAIEYLRNKPADVVLTDIKMLEVSGLEVAKYVHENLPNTKTVIISGYKEFEYAKKAIEYGVEHFLLKPTKFDEVCRIFRELKEKLDRFSEKEKAEQKEKEKYREMVPLLREQFFTDITMGALKEPEEIRKRLNILELPIDIHNAPCFLVDMEIQNFEQYMGEKWEYGRAGLNYALMNFFMEIRDQICFFPISRPRQLWKILIVGMKPMQFEDMRAIVEKLLENIRTSIKKILDLDIGFHSYKYFENLLDLADNHRIFQITINAGEMEGGFDLDPAEHKELMEKFKLFASNINDGDVGKIINLLESFMEDLRPYPIKYVQHFVIELLAVLTNRLNSMGLLEIEKEDMKKLDYHPLVHMNRFEEIKEYCRNALLALAKMDCRSRDASSLKLIEDAKKFIRENFHTDITLEDVADRVFLNSVYFSRIFKQITGESFIDYLTELRMKKAMQLIGENRHKVNEISRMVGYSNGNYFSKVFKQYTGCTPREFHRKHQLY